MGALPHNEALNPYINFHRPCLFQTLMIDAKGKQKKKYLYKDMMTPYEKFKSLPNVSDFLKEGITMEQLDKQAKAMSDNQAAEYLQQQRRILFKQIDDNCSKTA